MNTCTLVIWLLLLPERSECQESHTQSQMQLQVKQETFGIAFSQANTLAQRSQCYRGEAAIESQTCPYVKVM